MLRVWGLGVCGIGVQGLGERPKSKVVPLGPLPGTSGWLKLGNAFGAVWLLTASGARAWGF